MNAEEIAGEVRCSIDDALADCAEAKVAIRVDDEKLENGWRRVDLAGVVTLIRYDYRKEIAFTAFAETDQSDNLEWHFTNRDGEWNGEGDYEGVRGWLLAEMLREAAVLAGKEKA